MQAETKNIYRIQPRRLNMPNLAPCFRIERCSLVEESPPRIHEKKIEYVIASGREDKNMIGVLLWPLAEELANVLTREKIRWHTVSA